MQAQELRRALWKMVKCNVLQGDPRVTSLLRPMQKLPLHFFIIPLFALAFLLVSCSRTTAPMQKPVQEKMDGGSAMMKNNRVVPPFDGTLLTGMHKVTLHTSKGDIEVGLDADAAPKTVTNFVALAKTGFYDGLMFHRVIPSFMIQGGDPNGDGTGGSSVFGATFEDEINAASYGLTKKKLKDVAKGEEIPPQIANMTVAQYYESRGYRYKTNLKSLPMIRGAVAMANRGPNTNGSQFFIIQGPGTPWLEGKHTVFGNVTKGLDVLDAITNVPRGENDQPKEPVTFTVEVIN